MTRLKARRRSSPWPQDVDPLQRMASPSSTHADGFALAPGCWRSAPSAIAAIPAITGFILIRCGAAAAQAHLAALSGEHAIRLPTSRSGSHRRGVVGWISCTPRLVPAELASRASPPDGSCASRTCLDRGHRGRGPVNVENVIQPAGLRSPASCCCPRPAERPPLPTRAA